MNSRKRTSATRGNAPPNPTPSTHHPITESQHPTPNTQHPDPIGDNPVLSDVVERNVHKIIKLRREAERQKTRQDRIADWLTAFSGSMPFFYVHSVWFVAWIVINTGHTPIKPFDPFPFGFLTLVVSLEAIFLATFVLISQNRQAVIADRRADLDLHIDMLAEHEITRILLLVDAIADHFGLEAGKATDLDELEHDIAPEMILDEIDQWQKSEKNK